MNTTTSQSAHNAAPLDPNLLARMDAYWRACNYLAAGFFQCFYKCQVTWDLDDLFLVQIFASNSR